MPKQATRYVFSNAQTKRVQSFFPEFLAQVEQHDPRHEGRNAKITSWKKEKALELLNEPLFQDLDAGETSESWQSAIIRLYGNYFNAHIKKEKRPEKKRLATTNEKTRALVLFTGMVSPKALFALEKHSEITELYKSICKEKAIAGGPAKSEATRRLWEQEDPTEWEERAKSLASDIDAQVYNRAEFSDLILESMQRMIDGGALGSCVLSLSYAFRDDHNEVFGGRIHAGYDAVSGLPIEDDEFDEGEDVRKKWFAYAQQKLPRKSLSTITVIHRNTEGLPLFPLFNRKTKTYAEIAQILDDYLLTLWEHTQGSIRIPWDDIGKHPDCYYDTWIHRFPCKLSSPEDMGEIELTQLAMHLADKPTTEPFTFYEKARNPPLLPTSPDDDAGDSVQPENFQQKLADNAPDAHTKESGPSVPPDSQKKLSNDAPITPTANPTVTPGHDPEPPSAKDAAQDPPLDVLKVVKGTKRKRGKAAATPATSANGSVSATSTIRRGGRERKLATIGPALVTDPTLPPAKKVKHSFEYVPVVPVQPPV